MTTTQTHTLEYVLDGLPTLRLNNHRGDLHIVHDAEPGVVRLRLHTHRPVDFGPVEANVDGAVVTVRVPPLSDPEGGPGFSVSIGSFSWSAGASGVRVDVEVHMPPQATLVLDTGAGDIAVNGESGSVAAKSGAGDIQVEDACTVTLHSGAGDASTGRIGGGSLRTGTGDIRIQQCAQDTEINSGSGDVTVLDSATALRITTGAGDVNVMISGGRVDVRSGMGDVNIQVPSGVAVWQDLTTGVGEVRSRVQSYGEPEPGEPFVSVTARTGAGDVTLTQ
jgi:hypothetical protein